MTVDEAINTIEGECITKLKALIKKEEGIKGRSLTAQEKFDLAHGLRYPIRFTQQQVSAWLSSLDNN